MDTLTLIIQGANLAALLFVGRTMFQAGNTLGRIDETLNNHYESILALQKQKQDKTVCEERHEQLKE